MSFLHDPEIFLEGDDRVDVCHEPEIIANVANTYILPRFLVRLHFGVINRGTGFQHM